ncbi:hypothetical protein [Chryseobacterium sp. JK1]|uniref:hypothetical protein n=1 Tax=Chryseobacterium sp. JK1 TaxID=874294 RepID=UPI003D68C93C
MDFILRQLLLAASPLNSCDVFFTEKGKYLIFAYDKQDSDFLHSSQCFVQKRLDQLSPQELKELEALSTAYKKKAIENNQKLTNDIIEEIDQSDTKVHELTHEIDFLRHQNDKYKIIIYTFSLVIILFLITLIIIWKRRTHR